MGVQYNISGCIKFANFFDLNPYNPNPYKHVIVTDISHLIHIHDMLSPKAYCKDF